jgi:hypothetical protein
VTEFVTSRWRKLAWEGDLRRMSLDKALAAKSFEMWCLHWSLLSFLAVFQKKTQATPVQVTRCVAGACRRSRSPAEKERGQR